jgi:hypothetical protein
MQVKTISNPKCRTYSVLMDDEADKLHREIVREFRTRGVANPRSTSTATSTFRGGAYMHQHSFSLVEEVCDEYETRMGMTATSEDLPDDDKVDRIARRLSEWLVEEWYGLGKKHVSDERPEWTWDGGFDLEGGKTALRKIAAELIEIAAPSDERFPHGWLDIATAPPAEGGDWFLGRVAGPHRATGKDSIVIQRKTWQHCPWRDENDVSYPCDFFDAWKPAASSRADTSWVVDLLKAQDRDKKASSSETTTGEPK